MFRRHFLASKVRKRELILFHRVGGAEWFLAFLRSEAEASGQDSDGISQPSPTIANITSQKNIKDHA